MASALEKDTSEDGTTIEPITRTKIVTDDDNPDRCNQLSELGIRQKRTRKGHTRDKRHNKRKLAKHAEASSTEDSEGCSRIPSSNEENESPNILRLLRTLTGLEQNLINTTDLRDISSETHVDSRPSISATTTGASGLTREENILRYLEQISVVVDQNQIMLSQILRINQALSHVQGCTKPEGFPDFPIASSEIFDEFNEMLENEVHRTYLIQKLASVGGLSQRQAVMNMLKSVMSNDLAMMYNWAGRDKKCFKKTNFMKILYEAAKMAFRGKPESSDVNIASAVKDWLKLATSRHAYAITGRKK